MLMKENEHLKTILNTEPSGKQVTGRPRLRWIDWSHARLEDIGL